MRQEDVQFDMSSEKERFAHWLRGVAAFGVLIAHYVGVFNAIRRGMPAFPLLRMRRNRICGHG